MVQVMMKKTSPNKDTAMAHLTLEKTAGDTLFFSLKGYTEYKKSLATKTIKK